LQTEFHIYRDTLGHWRWYLSTASGRRLAESGEFYARRDDCEQAIALVRAMAAASPVIQQHR
jgi:uncharacterized protein YegP (UPF0339 family)